MKKQIVLELPNNPLVDLSEIKKSTEWNTKYFGVQVKPTERGFITKTGFDSGEYTIRCPDYLTKGNGWIRWNSKTLSGIIQNLLTMNSDDVKTIYVFDSFLELMTWVAEKS